MGGRGTARDGPCGVQIVLGALLLVLSIFGVVGAASKNLVLLFW